MNDKITPRHLTRKAIVYVRQSSPYQVAHNKESQRLQYAMEDQVRQLGWSDVEIIDEDLGRTANGAALRTGFERMVADVCLGNVGAIAARELSRFARNSRDWQKMIEVCRVVDTLLIDQETVYDARRSNDRLLLGLKGNLNEYELDLLRQCAWEARHEKAKRGEFFASIPSGFVKTESDGLERDPDERVRESLTLLFQKFFELGTARQVQLWFLGQQLQLPVRRLGDLGWEIQWRRPTYPQIYRILTNPAYAGAYAYGRTQTTSEFHDGQATKATRTRPRDQWVALIPNQHAGYISWEEFERIQEMLKQNSLVGDGMTRGAPKCGAALLAGLLRCGRCGRKLQVQYTGRASDVLRYVCSRGQLDSGEPRCITFGGQDVDRTVSDAILRVVEPGAIEAALIASRDAVSRQNVTLDALQRDLQAAQYAAKRAGKQYELSDPENRLVTHELERRWNAALLHVHELEQRITVEETRGCAAAPPGALEFIDLAGDLQSIWHDPETDVRLKKRIARTLIHEVLVDRDNTQGQILLTIHWDGGEHTQHQVRCRRVGENRLHAAPEIVEAVRQLSRIGSDAEVASWLSRNGLRTGHGNRWTMERVTSLRSHHKIPRHSSEEQEKAGWMTLGVAARLVGVSHTTLRKAVARGEVNALHPLPIGPWIFQQEDLKSNMARTLAERTRRHCQGTAPLSGQGNLDFSET